MVLITVGALHTYKNITSENFESRDDNITLEYRNHGIVIEDLPQVLNNKHGSNMNCSIMHAAHDVVDFMIKHIKKFSPSSKKYESIRSN